MDCQRCKLLETMIDAHESLYDQLAEALRATRMKPLPREEKKMREPTCSNCGREYEWDENRRIYSTCPCHKADSDATEWKDYYTKEEIWKMIHQDGHGFVTQDSEYQWRKALLDFLYLYLVNPKTVGEGFWEDLRKRFL